MIECDIQTPSVALTASLSTMRFEFLTPLETIENVYLLSYLPSYSTLHILVNIMCAKNYNLSMSTGC